MIGAPVPGVVNALQVTTPGRSPSVPSVKALGKARDEKKNRASRGYFSDKKIFKEGFFNVSLKKDLWDFLLSVS